MSVIVRSPLGGRRRAAVVAALAFALGILVDTALTARLTTRARGTPLQLAPVIESTVPVHDTIETPVERPENDAAGPVVGTTGAAERAASVETLRNHVLAVPVQGVKRSDLHDTFSDSRGSTRAHEAIDIMAARRTPVIAAEEGRIAKLFTSKAGGLTIYQFDPTETFCYYYAHLDGYANDLREGQTVQRGEVLGYVGSTGNASADAPHLHFAIFRLTPEREWWKGDPINPYPVLR